MAISVSFHRNVLLLSQVIQPSDEFKKHFREGMFDKPNTTGFLHTSHYLLTIYDSEHIKKLIEWPVICKKTEAKYRNNVKDYLTIISMENPDISFPNILMSHLIHAGGSKFAIIMWKLSQVVLRRYIARETTYNVAFAPQIGSKGNLAKKFLQKTNTQIDFNILNEYESLSEIRNATKFVLEKEKETLSNIIEEIFEKEQLIINLTHTAPVHPSIKKCLRDINNEEVIKMWKMNINKGINQIQVKNAILKDIEQLAYKVNNIVLSNNSDIKMLNVEQLQKINHLKISELFPPNIQCLLFQLYKDDKIMLNNLILLFNFLFIQLKQQLKLDILEDFSECLLQIETNTQSIKTALNIIQTYLLDIRKIILETQDILRQRNIIQIHDDAGFPVNNMLMLSPLIKINMNYNGEESDLQKRLQLTPVEATHKSLFSRYERLKQNHTSHETKLRENLLVSRINFDDTIASINNGKQSLHMDMLSSRKNLLSFKQAEKYSRLFSSRIKRNNRNNRTANSSMVSIPCPSKANSTVLATATEKMHDISELSLDISTKSLCNLSAEFTTPEKLIIKQDKSENISKIEDIMDDFTNKADVLNICEIDVEIKNNIDNNIIETKQAKQNRRSIGDLVERYKKLLEASNRTPSPKIRYVKCENK